MTKKKSTTQLLVRLTNNDSFDYYIFIMTMRFSVIFLLCTIVTFKTLLKYENDTIQSDEIRHWMF